MYTYVVFRTSWERRKVGQVVVLVIDALRADFVLPRETLDKVSGLEVVEDEQKEAKIWYLTELLKNDNSGVEAYVAKAHSPTVTLPRIKVILRNWMKTLR